MKKKVCILLSILLLIVLAGCTKPAEEPVEEPTEITYVDGIAAPNTSDTKISIGVTPIPHAEIVNDVVKAKLEKAGWTVEVVEFNDYVLPNTALQDGDLDANYFQTIAYLDEQNEERGLTLRAIFGVHLEPMGCYSNTITSVDEITADVTIAIPNDGSNESRALKLLEDNGLIVLKETDGLYDLTSVDDEKSLVKSSQISELDAPAYQESWKMLPWLSSNGNYALSSGLNPLTDALFAEKADSEESYKYINYIVVRADDEDSVKSLALEAAFNNQDVVDYINEKYSGTVIPAF